MKGRASTLLGNNNEISKWSALHHVMREKKIGILCVQETHLLPEHEEQIETLYSKRIKVLNSRDPLRPGNSAGVAFVVNKEILDPNDLKTIEIIPGRALALRIKWHNETYLTLANIYASNNHTQHPDFWNTIARLWQEKNIPYPDFLMGDFNITEDALDRAPARLDNEQAIEALRNLRFQLNIQDSWRMNNPTLRAFTFYSNANSHSRLDRIYSSPVHELSIYGWDSCTSAIPTDHRMILVRYAPTNTPFVGKGRWSWPISLLNDEKFIKKISEIGRQTQREITNHQQRTETENPQRSWENFKSKIRHNAKTTAKEHLYKIRQRVKQLEEDLRKTTENNDIDTNESTRRQKAWIENSRTNNNKLRQNGQPRAKQ
ncbi:Endonuclease/exonuclease/phosphatase [Suillus tomentosus]|nr:Endonuclease/exonuclease/phosphatase [Suillus tomentosus]